MSGHAHISVFRLIVSSFVSSFALGALVDLLVAKRWHPVCERHPVTV